jgi:hypothetical protein
MDEVLQTILQQLKRKDLKRSALFKDFVGVAHSVPFPDSASSFVSEWLESVGSEDHPIPRRLTKSAPEMEYSQDAEGFMVPPTPASRAGSIAPSDLTSASPGSGQSSGRSLVEDPLYRDMNLAANNIYMQHPCDPIPERTASLVDYVRQDRESPGPSLDEVGQDRDLYDLSIGAGEPDVEKYFHTHIFPDTNSSDSLKHSDRQPMAKHAVPGPGSKLKVSTPVPDMLYGYNRHEAFPHQQAQLNSMGTEMVANNQGLLYPFFVIEFRGDGPSGSGSLWVATNKCVGGSASCVNIAERLGHQLRHCESDKVRLIGSAAFGVAMSGTEARLFISWKQSELETYMANVDSFLLQKPKDYLEFRKHVLNIIKWGKDQRLNDIRDSLDSLLEESRMRASKAAKSRQPPSSDSATSSDRRRKSTSSRGGGGVSNSLGRQSIGADEPYRELDEATGQWYHTDADGTVTAGRTVVFSGISRVRRCQTLLSAEPARRAPLQEYTIE